MKDIQTNTATRITVGPFFDKTDGRSCSACRGRRRAAELRMCGAGQMVRGARFEGPDEARQSASTAASMVLKPAR